jgi:hypothetical protein
MINKIKVHDWFENLDKFLFLWLACFVLNSITFLFVHYKIHPTNRTLALHYNVIVGVDWYGAGKNLYNIPLIGFLITLVNVAFFNAVKNRQHFISFLAIFTTFVVQVFLLLAVLFLAKVN